MQITKRRIFDHAAQRCTCQTMHKFCLQQTQRCHLGEKRVPCCRVFLFPPSLGAMGQQRLVSYPDKIVCFGIQTGDVGRQLLELASFGTRSVVPQSSEIWFTPFKEPSAPKRLRLRNSSFSLLIDVEHTSTPSLQSPADILSLVQRWLRWNHGDIRWWSKYFWDCFVILGASTPTWLLKNVRSSCIICFADDVIFGENDTKNSWHLSKLLHKYWWRNLQNSVENARVSELLSGREEPVIDTFGVKLNLPMSQSIFLKLVAIRQAVVQKMYLTIFLSKYVTLYVAVFISIDSLTVKLMQMTTNWWEHFQCFTNIQGNFPIAKQNKVGDLQYLKIITKI